MYCVVGSGPAGIACAQALLKAGAKVTLLNAGAPSSSRNATRAWRRFAPFRTSSGRRRRWSSCAMASLSPPAASR
jgi:glycine/D-amino acid oxidase-like deaminating enzyme